MSFTNLFSLSVAYLLIFSAVSFAEKVVILVKFSLSVISFMVLYLSKKSSYTQGHLGFLF